MKATRIVCYSAFWGDSASAIDQFIEEDGPQVDYIVADYLAELTMGLLARSATQSKISYISEFLDLVVAPNLPLILKKGVKIVTNAGGLDPVGLKTAIEAHLQQRGLGNSLKIAAVFGDDLLSQYKDLREDGAFESFDPLSGAGAGEVGIEQTKKLLSLNAYIGAEAITEALKQDAQIVVTGRCVDSALVVGPLAFEYGWNYTTQQEDLDRLASASLAGHIIECGAQATGGNFTDWKKSAFSPHGGWANMGYPILTYDPKGTFSISKPDRTGGVVTCDSVCEQMLYEVHDPENYILPDVVVDMSQVTLEQYGLDNVVVRNVKGKPPTPWLKCTAVEQRGFRISVDILVCGDEAESKAKTLGRAIIDRTNAIAARRFSRKTLPITSEDSAIMLIGNESSLGTVIGKPERREIALRVAARHETRQVLDILSKDAASFLTNSCPGICLLTSGRAKSTPNFVARSILVDRSRITPRFLIGNAPTSTPLKLSTKGCKRVEVASSHIQVDRGIPIPTQSALQQVRLGEIAVGRSGDKGDTANIAIIARNPTDYQSILDQVTPEAVFSRFNHFIANGGTVTRFEVPGVSAVNFVITRCLGGGGLSSLRLDR